MNDFKVSIEYKNKKLQTVSERIYEFEEYVDELQLNIKRVITDVEDAFYQMQGKQKEEWDEDIKLLFEKIRHKLLDQANAIKRLPSTLNFRDIPCDSKNFSEVIAEILNS